MPKKKWLTIEIAGESMANLFREGAYPSRAEISGKLPQDAKFEHFEAVLRNGKPNVVLFYFSSSIVGGMKDKPLNIIPIFYFHLKERKKAEAPCERAIRTPNG